MPNPVSSTVSTASLPSARSATRIWPPAGVYLTALVTMLVSTCSSRTASASTHTGSVLISMLPIQPASPVNVATARRTASARSSGCRFSRIFPRRRARRRADRRSGVRCGRPAARSPRGRESRRPPRACVNSSTLDGAADRAERIAQLVGQHRQELVLRAAVALGAVAVAVGLEELAAGPSRSDSGARRCDDTVVVSDRLTSKAPDPSRSAGCDAVAAAGARAAPRNRPGRTRPRIGRCGCRPPTRAARRRAPRSARWSTGCRRDRREDDGAFLHLFDEVAVRLLGAVQRVDLVAAGALDDQRVDLALPNRPQHVLGFGETRAQRLRRSSRRFGVWLAIIALTFLRRWSRAERDRVPGARARGSDMSPMIRRIGSGSFLMSVGAAMICSPLVRTGCW